MRITIAFRRLLLPAFALLAVACDDTTSPLEPSMGQDPTPAAETDVPSSSVPARWAAGYLHAGAPTTASCTPVPYLSYNRPAAP